MPPVRRHINPRYTLLHGTPFDEDYYSDSEIFSSDSEPGALPLERVYSEPEIRPLNKKEVTNKEDDWDVADPPLTALERLRWRKIPQLITEDVEEETSPKSTEGNQFEYDRAPSPMVSFRKRSKAYRAMSIVPLFRRESCFSKQRASFDSQSLIDSQYGSKRRNSLLRKMSMPFRYGFDYKKVHVPANGRPSLGHLDFIINTRRFSAEQFPQFYQCKLHNDINIVRLSPEKLISCQQIAEACSELLMITPGCSEKFK